ncbi:hypothetical protein GUJ93_ZPchr0005g16361 [Zizania palustris]|uniref:Uncharacterized protein n=1 Tax=Zizania palustris TaxID=103762 RepID=A0A8J5T9W2_ZIZPA|nr:hypothetical protein GUJ93_ZPchr0005g16361 [Zizania palustris]
MASSGGGFDDGIEQGLWRLRGSQQRLRAALPLDGGFSGGIRRQRLRAGVAQGDSKRQGVRGFGQWEASSGGQQATRGDFG